MTLQWTLGGGLGLRGIVNVHSLVFGQGSRGITAVAFSGGQGRYLTTVATDNQHTVRVWDWSVGRVVARGAGYTGAPPQVQIHPHDPCMCDLHRLHTHSVDQHMDDPPFCPLHLKPRFVLSTARQLPMEGMVCTPVICTV